MKLYKRGAELGTTATPGTALTGSFWINVMDVNNQDSNIVAPSNKIYGGYLFAAPSIPNASQPVLDYIWERGMRILGRSVT